MQSVIADYGYAWDFPGFPGYMRYELSGENDDVVSWNETRCDALSDDGSVCIDDVASGTQTGVSLVPDDDVSLEDLPIEVDVEATYVAVFPYGNELYTFELKDYTFTKEWVGGFLTLDKEVDNHVLTWAGPDVTLDAANASTASVDPWTSTVHVTVSNDSGSDIYNVTIRDAVPAELGVVESTISNGGTYDSQNHVVTWDFNSSPALQDVLQDEQVELEFDVYARQKPGYCWDSTDSANFDVQPDDPADCYADPYAVTNGRASGSVTAAGFFEPDDVSGSQPVFEYRPEDDESDIWVVRPIFEITKERVSQSVMERGASATYELSITNVDRSDDDGEAYELLRELYPWEFGDDTQGDGHQAPGYELRNNAYAQGLEVTDAWEVGLDFTNGTPFTANGDTLGTIDTSNAGTDKEVSWSVAELDAGVTGVAQLTLTGNLLSDDGEGNALNNSDTDYDPSDPLEDNIVTSGAGTFNAWNNCLYLGADQLNQPGKADVGDTWYATVSNAPWTQSQITTDSDAEWLQESVDATSSSDFRFGGSVEGLALPDVCDPVAVVPPSGEPSMNLSTNGEAPDSDPGDPQNENVNVDDVYYYRFTSQNVGDQPAQDVVIEVEDLGGSSPDQMGFTGTADLYVSSDGGVSDPWSSPAGVGATLAGNVVTFDAIDVSPGEWIRVVIEAEALDTGEFDVDAELTYGNPGTQSVPVGPVSETTVINP